MTNKVSVANDLSTHLASEPNGSQVGSRTSCLNCLLLCRDLVCFFSYCGQASMSNEAITSCCSSMWQDMNIPIAAT